MASADDDCIRIDSDQRRQTAISATVGVIRKHQRTTAAIEGNDSPAATPRNATNWAKFDSASVATPADVMARQTDSVQLEFDQYVAQVPISRSSCPMLWWAQHKPSYQILSSVAQTMLCVPATSIASEHVFFPKLNRPNERAKEIRWRRQKPTLSFF